MDSLNVQPRILAIDLARGVSVLGMMLVHTMWMYGRPEMQEDAWSGQLVEVVGRCTALFLIAMGFSWVLSRRKNGGDALRRGLGLVAVGYLMNVLMFLPPTLLGIMPKGFFDAYGFSQPLGVQEWTFLLLTGDILQLAGLALPLMALVHACSKDRRFILVMSCLVAASSGLMRGYRPGVPGLDYFCDLLWGASYNVYFPVLPWLSPILLGMYFGALYRDSGRQEAPVFRAMLRLGFLFCAVGGILCYRDPEYHLADFFHAGPGGAYLSMGTASVLLWLAPALTPWFSWSPLRNLVLYASRRVTHLYVIHWVLLVWGVSVLGFRDRGMWEVLLLWPMVVLATLAVDRVTHVREILLPRAHHTVAR